MKTCECWTDSAEVQFALFFDCSEAVMEAGTSPVVLPRRQVIAGDAQARILERGKTSGRPGSCARARGDVFNEHLDICSGPGRTTMPKPFVNG